MTKIIAVGLIALGLSSLAWGGFTYKTREKVLDLGPIEATHEKTHRVPIAPIAGVVVLGAGIALLVLRKG